MSSVRTPIWVVSRPDEPKGRQGLGIVQVGEHDQQRPLAKRWLKGEEPVAQFRRLVEIKIPQLVQPLQDDIA